MKNLILIFVVLSLLVLPVHGQTASLFYSSKLVTGDTFTWERSLERRQLNDSSIISSSVTEVEVELIRDLANVEATPILIFSEYVKYSENGSERAGFGNEFYYKVHEQEFPLIAPNRNQNGTAYLTSLNDYDSFKSKADLERNGDHIDITINNQYSDINTTYNIELVASYDINSGVLVSRSYQIDVDGSIDDYRQTEYYELLSAPEYVSIPGKTSDVTFDNLSSIDSPILLLFLLTITLVRLQTKNFNHQ